MSRRKILFFIVEGPSDRTALAAALEKIYKDQSVIVRVVGGDITSSYNNQTHNISSRIVEQIKFELGRMIKPGDILKVIHLVDLDGTFISDEKVIYSNVEKTVYEDDCILCKIPENIIKRNKQKTAILNKLITMNKVWKTVDYKVYFFSCNLDHVLHDTRNLDDNLKVDCATRFARKYKEDTDGFKKFFCDSEFSLHGDYVQTWDFVKENNNSLKRYTNFNLVFEESTEIEQ